MVDILVLDNFLEHELLLEWGEHFEGGLHYSAAVLVGGVAEDIAHQLLKDNVQILLLENILLIML